MTVYQLARVPEGPAAFCQTPAATEMLAVLDWTIKLKSLGTIVGPPGLGKTTVLRHYADENRGAIYCVISPAEHSMSRMLRRVADALRLPQLYRGAAALERAICEDVRCRRPRVLMIDEAQHLEDRALDELRCIHDETGLPIVFAGNESLRARSTPGAPAAFAQFVSRIGPRAHVTATGDDIAALAAHYGVADPKAVAWLREACAGIGGLRVAGRLLAVCRETGRGRVSLADLKGAALLLGGGA